MCTLSLEVLVGVKFALREKRREKKNKARIGEGKKMTNALSIGAPLKFRTRRIGLAVHWCGAPQHERR